MDFGRGWRRMDDVKRKQVVDGIWAVWEDFFCRRDNRKTLLREYEG
jgi:hypothetical protein